MKAIILAAGRGSRMKDLTEECPKCLVKLQGRPLLEWQLAAIRKAGIDDIAIVTGYKREQLAGFGLTEFHNPRWQDTQMLASLACAAEWLQQAPCIVSYSDIFYDYTGIELLMQSTAELAVTYDPNWLSQWTERFGDPLSDAETFRLNPDGTLAEIGNKPKSVEEIQGQYMGLLRFTPPAWQLVRDIVEKLPPPERDRLHMTGLMQKVIEQGQMPIAAIPYLHPWGEVDTAEDLVVHENSLSGAG